MPTPDINFTVRDALINNWLLGSPLTSADIDWVAKRVDIASWLKSGLKNYLIACYSPGAVTSRVIALNWWRVDEVITIDVLVKASVENATDKRTSIKEEILRIIHANQTSMANIRFASLAREPVQIEAENLLNVRILVNCMYFHSKS